MSEAVPDLVPIPIAVGTYATDSDIHFYLASFVDMTDDVPELEQLPAKIAELHSKAVSPNGKFGFSVPTNMGACTQQNAWTSSWEKSFSAAMSTMFNFEQDMHGRNEEMQEMHQIILNKVIPRLLRPLETEGRSIAPRLVHGDLWDGNTSVDATTDQPIIFDASGMYAHNECKSQSTTKESSS
jgi:protein-ribulosamine 3-kinase